MCRFSAPFNFVVVFIFTSDWTIGRISGLRASGMDGGEQNPRYQKQPRVVPRSRPAQAQYQGLKRSGLSRLRDAENPENSLDGGFDLAYGAAHALCLAALRYRGFRPVKRYIVFQVLPDTLGLGPEVWRVLSKCHDLRNRTCTKGRLKRTSGWSKI